jgi:hypothetical protein
MKQQLIVACPAQVRQIRKNKIYYLGDQTLASPEQAEVAISTGKIASNMYQSICMITELTLEIR